MQRLYRADNRANYVKILDCTLLKMTYFPTIFDVILIYPTNLFFHTQSMARSVLHIMRIHYYFIFNF